jgi:hypothetical protein
MKSIMKKIKYDEDGKDNTIAFEIQFLRIQREAIMQSILNIIGYVKRKLIFQVVMTFMLTE